MSSLDGKLARGARVSRKGLILGGSWNEADRAGHKTGCSACQSTFRTSCALLLPSIFRRLASDLFKIGWRVRTVTDPLKIGLHFALAECRFFEVVGRFLPFVILRDVNDPLAALDDSLRPSETIRERPS
jgi:hypothetical protein